MSLLGERENWKLLICWSQRFLLWISSAIPCS